MGAPPFRRDTFRDMDRTSRYTDKLGTFTARAFLAVATRPEVDYHHMLVLLAAAHHADLMRVAEKEEPTYATDVADLVGCTPARAGLALGDLKRAGLLTGSAAAGYVPLLEPGGSTRREGKNRGTV